MLGRVVRGAGVGLGRGRLGRLVGGRWQSSSAGAPPEEPLETKRRRLLYQAKKRGILENDILLGDFAARHLPSLSAQELRDFDALINGEHNEWDIYYWLSDTQEVPDDVQTPVFNKLKTFAWSDDRIPPKHTSQDVHVVK